VPYNLWFMFSILAFICKRFNGCTYLLIEMTKVETQVYYKSRVGMPANLALCIVWARDWECRLNISVFVVYRKLLLLQKYSSSAAYPTGWLLWRPGYWGSWRQAWVGCGRYGDRPLEICLAVASGKLYAYFQKRDKARYQVCNLYEG
jgi:hypothetical protein